MKIHHLLVLLLFFGCDGSSSEQFAYSDAEADLQELIEVPTTRQASQQKSKEPDGERITKKLIKTGGVEFESKDIEADYKKTKELLPKFKGYIENENQNKSSHRISYNLTVRVPADGYDTLYGSISNMAYRLDNKYSNVEDATARYYDLKTRIENKKALEERYVELLKKANTIRDVLEIERNLNEIRTEIERIEGRFKYLSKQISLSTIQISFYEVLPYTYDSTNRKGFGARILGALDNGWQGFLSFLIGITTLWPFVLILIVSIWSVRKIRRNWKKK